MDVRDALRLTGASLRAHKLRSLLAAIGVMLGIASVIGVVTLGAGFQSAVTGVINGQVDSTTIIVGVQTKGQQGPGDGGGFGASATKPFTDRDLAALAGLSSIKNGSASQTLPTA